MDMGNNLCSTVRESMMRRAERSEWQELGEQDKMVWDEVGEEGPGLCQVIQATIRGFSLRATKALKNWWCKVEDRVRSDSRSLQNWSYWSTAFMMLLSAQNLNDLHSSVSITDPTSQPLFPVILCSLLYLFFLFFSCYRYLLECSHPFISISWNTIFWAITNPTSVKAFLIFLFAIFCFFEPPQQFVLLFCHWIHSTF